MYCACVLAYCILLSNRYESHVITYITLIGAIGDALPVICGYMAGCRHLSSRYYFDTYPATIN